ncbi:hypothetical protein HF888_02565 [Bermanella marisrubri]|uniref:Uncharacterized protein n=1 Tax=Bermanella marisrubri TaxID=207949 RepID=Q1N3L5_9GAMM|nr:hypothetical protein [Bermanella marisrubri]EAT12859.1 hypothetical protein RED65_12339 [Oceanobacter sp. RED65] [Bermanella marisrubri]QIZ83180.1 hypothetical protein HF888_02565 [Bermanella marisrubri]
MMSRRLFDLWIDNRVIMARVRGSWDDQIAKEFATAFRALGEQLYSTPPGHWAHIVYLDDWQLGTPDIEPIVIELVNWAITHGLTRTAQVYSPSMLKQFQMDRMVEDHREDFIRRIYPNERDAFAWLDSEGYAVTKSTLEIN